MSVWWYYALGIAAGISLVIACGGRVPPWLAGISFWIIVVCFVARWARNGKEKAS